MKENHGEMLIVDMEIEELEDIIAPDDPLGGSDPYHRILTD